MNVEDDPLLQRADAAVAEALRLCQALEQSQEQVRHEARHLAWIEAMLDPLPPHPAEELRRVGELLAREPNP